MFRRGTGFRPAPLLLATAAALTALVAVRTFWYLFHSITDAPFTDGWLILDEIRRFREGSLDWTFFWTPYWGQRNVVARVLFFLAVKYFSFAAAPLIVVNVVAWLSMLAVLVWAARQVCAGRVFLMCAIALAHLALSSLGMEVLVITQNVQHSIAYASAVSAILLFPRRPWAGIALAALATASMAIGLVVWPLLLVEAWYARMRARSIAIVAALMAGMVAFYMIGYTRPPAYGIGFAGALRHPGVAFSMTSLVLGGPITLYSLRLGTVAGAIGLGVLAWFMIRRRERGMDFAVTMAALLLAGSAAALAVARISPEWLAALHGAQPLPSRYIAPTLIFWGCLFVLAWGRSELAPKIVVSAIVLVITFGTWSWQWRVSREWAVAMQRFDAIASGFVAGVADEESMSLLLTDAAVRDRLVGYMRQEHLAMFAEPRARWMGQQFGAAAPCRGSLSTAAVGGGVRVAGSVEGAGRFDLVIAGGDGIVNGLARSLPAQSEGQAAVDFFGYARGLGPWRVFVLRGGRAPCEMKSE
jgi:hypothetical protein